MTQFPHITANPAILGGKPCLKDTRISVELIMEWIASGATPDTIVAKFPHLNRDAVQEAILYAAAFVRNEIFIEVKLAA
ncbi:MAG: DUF433 domain-containing protein [Rudanella sp.]|nr:DUF433 domain-containing protein [Rudanella sp.]